MLIFQVGHMRYAMPLSKLLQVPFTFTVHDVFFDRFPEYYFKTLQEAASAITFPSKIFLDIWANKTNSVDRLYVLPNAVANDDFSQNNIYSDHEVIGIVSIGRLAPVKRISDGLHAIRLLLNHGVMCHYTIIGTGAEEDVLYELAKNLDIKDHVSFLGAQPHVRVIAELQKMIYLFTLVKMKVSGLLLLKPWRLAYLL